MVWIQSSMPFLTMMVIWHQWMVLVTSVCFKTLFGRSCCTLRHVILCDGCKMVLQPIVKCSCTKKIRSWVLSQKTANPWPAHCPDFNLLDFYFLAAVQNLDFQGIIFKTELTRISSSARRSVWRSLFSAPFVGHLKLFSLVFKVIYV